jgi:hypothetical protein
MFASNIIGKESRNELYSTLAISTSALVFLVLTRQKMKLYILVQSLQSGLFMTGTLY